MFYVYEFYTFMRYFKSKTKITRARGMMETNNIQSRTFARLVTLKPVLYRQSAVYDTKSEWKRSFRLWKRAISLSTRRWQISVSSNATASSCPKSQRVGRDQIWGKIVAKSNILQISINRYVRYGRYLYFYKRDVNSRPGIGFLVNQLLILSRVHVINTLTNYV